jgi:hypothetical protein
MPMKKIAKAVPHPAEKTTLLSLILTLRLLIGVLGSGRLLVGGFGLCGVGVSGGLGVH